MATCVLTALAAASALLLLLLTSQPWTAEGAASDRYKLCLYACLDCVQTWGKEQFNGELCANRCHLTLGASLDPTCASYFIRSSRKEGAARQQLQLQRQQQQLLQRQQQRLHSYDPRHPPYGYPSGSLALRPRTPATAQPLRTPPAGPSGLTLTEQDRVQHCRRLCSQCPSRIVVDRDPFACMYTCVSLPGGNILC